MEENTKIVVERQWIINNPRYKDPIFIYKTYLRSDYSGKKIPNSTVYSVEYGNDNSECFKTFAEARKYAKEV